MFWRIVKIFTFIVFSITISFPLWLPPLYNNWIRDHIDTVYSGLDFELASVDLRQIQIANLRIKNSQMDLSANSIKVDLNWFKFLLSKELEKITVQGALWNYIEKVIKKPPLKTQKFNKEISEVSHSSNELPIKLREIILIESKLEISNGVTLPLQKVHTQLEDKSGHIVIDIFGGNEMLKLNIDLSFDKITDYHSFEIDSELVFLQNDESYKIAQFRGNEALFSIKSFIGKQIIHLNKMNSGDIEIELNGQDLGMISDLRYSGHLDDLEMLNHPMNFSWDLSKPNGSMLQGNIHLSIPELKNKEFAVQGLQLNLVKANESPWTLSGIVQHIESDTIAIDKLSLVFPIDRETKPGLIDLSMQHSLIGEVTSQITLNVLTDGLSYTGNINLDKVGLIELPFNGDLGWSLSDGPKFLFNSSFENKEMSLFTEEFGLMEGHFSSMLNANLNFSFGLKSGWQESVDVSWKEGFFSNSDFSMTLNGLEGHVHSNRLSSLSTGPAQQLSWKSFKASGMSFENGEIFWQWEQDQKLFIESLQLDWCGGRLSLLPIRLDSKNRDFKVIFFCERVQLAEVLKAFQVGEVEGEGELGGKLSLSYQKGHWEFEDTYLYSDPAKQGRLLIKEAQLLDQAMGMSKLQLARESLKDYNYKWAKLNFVSEEDNLLIKLVMDGKPNGLLPFRFDPKTATFIYDKKSPGVNLQGLKLNTNFRSEQFMPLLQKSLNFLKKVELGE